MRIQVLGSGCPTCHKLYELTKQAARDLGIPGDVEYVTDVTKIIEMGVMTSPVLAVDGKPVMTGFVPDVEQVKEALKKGMDADCTGGSCNCQPGCCGRCQTD